MIHEDNFGVDELQGRVGPQPMNDRKLMINDRKFDFG